MVFKVSPELSLAENWSKNHQKVPTLPTTNIRRQRELKQCYDKNREHWFIKTYLNKWCETDNKYATLFFLTAGEGQY